MSKRRLISACAIVVMLIGGLSLMAQGAPPTSNPGTPFKAVLDKLDQVLAGVDQLVTTITGGAAIDAWDQVLPNSSRFVVLSAFNNEAFLDRETSLVWERGASAVTPGIFPNGNWVTSMALCYNKSTGGRKGWRPATVEELTSLLSTTFDGTFAPFTRVFSAMWTSSTVFGDTTKAWVVASSPEFNTAVASTKTDCCGFGVWCVRGRPGNDGQ